MILDPILRLLGIKKRGLSELDTTDKVCIAFTYEGLSIAYVNSLGKPSLEMCKFFPATSVELYPKLVRAFVEEYELKGKNCVLVLPMGKYDTYLVDAPKVEEKELTQALSWQVKDLLEYAVEDAAIDYIELPAATVGAKQVYVVSSQKSYVEQQVAWINMVGLKVRYVTIPELALRNLMVLMPQNKEGMIFIYPGLKHSEILALKQDVLYFMRRIPLDLTAAIAEGYDVDDAVREELIEELAMETERSLSFCAKKLYPPPGKNLVVVQLGVHDTSNYANMARKLNLTLNMMVLNTIVSVGKDVNEEEVIRCILAIGGAIKFKGAI